MRPLTPAQLKLIHTLLGQADLMERKADLVYSFSNGRTESSRELSLFEAKEMIEFLKRATDSQQLIKAIWFIAYEMEIISGSGADHNGMNAAKLDLFCKSRGSVKKNLREQNYQELKKTHRQFEAMYQKYKQKRENEKELSRLENKMTAFIASEDYEMCTAIRQQINEIRKQLPQGRKKKIQNVKTTADNTNTHPDTSRP